MNFFENLKKINLIHSQPQNRTLWFDGAHHPSNHADEQWPLSIPLRETAGFSLRSFILKNKAMSLTEVLLAIAVLGLLMASLLGAFVMGVKFLEKEEAKTDILANNAALIFNTIERDLREAVMITIAEEKTVEFISCPDSVPGLDTGTAALWHFNEGSGLAYDETANHNDGTIYQAIRTTAGEDNRGLDFDGVDDYVSCQDSLSLDLTAKLSIEAWIQPDSTGAIIYKEGAYKLIIKSDARLEGAIYYAAGWHSITTLIADAVLLDGQTWTNVAMVYDKDAEGTEELKLYINGRIVGTGNHSTPVEASNNVLFIGKDELGNSPFDGRIDEVRISNIARD
ncbi:MAG: LamG domain-containing protein, partial [Candidatus Omnitrophota bacterium]